MPLSKQKLMWLLLAFEKIGLLFINKFGHFLLKKIGPTQTNYVFILNCLLYACVSLEGAFGQTKFFFRKIFFSEDIKPVVDVIKLLGREIWQI